MSLSGPANARNVDKVIPAFRSAIATKKRITLNFSNTRTIDARFLGLLLMLKKKLKSTGATITFVGLSPGLQRIFHLSRLEFVHKVERTLGVDSHEAPCCTSTSDRPVTHSM